jgi:hypothetical protein
VEILPRSIVKKEIERRKKVKKFLFFFATTKNLSKFAIPKLKGRSLKIKISQSSSAGRATDL